MTAYASQYSLGGSSPSALNPELAVYKNKKIPCKSTFSAVYAQNGRKPWK